MNENINKEFSHLKIHTQYSICEGALRTADLAKYCKTNKIKAVGLCDSYNLCGALEFSETIAKSKTQPIIGTQINIKYKENFGKIPFFAKTLQGYKNLIKLSSMSYLEIKNNEEPHCNFEDIEKNSKGLILFSGSIEGLIGKLFSKNLTDEIFIIFERLKKKLNEDFYLEIQRHDDDGEKLFENFLINSSKKLHIPIIATHEVFYLDKDMHEAHDAFICIGEKTYVNVKDRKKYSENHYFKTSKEMHELFQDLPDALENNVNFPLRISFRPKNSPPILPNIQTSKTHSVDDLLIKESSEGLKEKLKEYVFPESDKEKLEQVTDTYNKRLNHEIEIICKMKYSSYFLIVSDYIKWAKKK